MAAGKLREAAARGNLQEVLRLVEEGAKIQPDENGRNALHQSASAGHADIVAALILAGCDVNVSDSSGCTALQRAAAEGHLEVVKQLIKHGADVNRQDNVHGNTALHEASWKGYSRSVAALGKARANLHLKNCGGFAALHLCCQNGHNQSCRELLLAGCNPDLQNNYGDTPLHTSARYGHAGVTRILISAQCRVSDQNKNGDTALHIAAAMGRRKLTRILLEAGCDKSLKNKQNETARDIATRKDLNEILVILNSPSATRSKSKSGKGGHEKDRNEKKRGKNESGTSSKDSSSRQKDKKKHKNTHKVHFERSAGTGKQWSPYGCHYYPDPKAFPQPNLDSLPHEPLRKGEQYYLDLAGNICKGPVGVGYTCYCAPFFRHMEARLDRDKQELKEHIDQAHQRLDQKVSNLERRTQGQLSELTRCVVAERALCDQRHLHLAQWLSRGAAGRSSERVRGTDPPDATVPRARSLEHLLDHQTEWKDQQLSHSNVVRTKMGLRNGQDHRSLEMLAGDDGVASWRRHPYQNSAHEISSREQRVHQGEDKSEALKPKGQPCQTYAHELALRLKQGFHKCKEFPKQEHNKSFETLLDKDVASWRGQPLRRSAHELPASRTNNNSTNDSNCSNFRDRHNRSFDTLLDQRPWRDQHHYRSVNELPASQHQRSQDSFNCRGLCQPQELKRSFDVLVDKDVRPWADQMQQRSAETHGGMEDGHTSPSRKEKYNQETKEPEEQSHIEVEVGSESPDWRGQPLRRSVHEMVARFQSAQARQVTPNWKNKNKSKLVAGESAKFSEKKHNEPQELKASEVRMEHDWQNYHTGNPTWRGEGMVVHGTSHYVDNASSESSDGEDGEAAANPDYENVVTWQAEESRLMSGLPYRSRSAVYSPTNDPPDLHNDSGYSTKLYGSSKGPSPSLSGQLDCDGILPTQTMFSPNKLPNMCDQPQPVSNASQRNRYHERGEDDSATNIVTASLV